MKTNSAIIAVIIVALAATLMLSSVGTNFISSAFAQKLSICVITPGGNQIFVPKAAADKIPGKLC